MIEEWQRCVYLLNDCPAENIPDKTFKKKATVTSEYRSTSHYCRKSDAQRLLESNDTVQKSLNNRRTLFVQHVRSPHANEAVTFSLLILYNIDGKVLHGGMFTNLKKKKGI
jgi:hypothetical protein